PDRRKIQGADARISMVGDSAILRDPCYVSNMAPSRHLTSHCIAPANGAHLASGESGGELALDGYTFTIELVKAITSMLAAFALPAALVVSVWLFKEKLGMLLLLFRVRHKDWEASFRWDKAEAEAKRLPLAPYDPAAEPTPEEKSRFAQIARSAPREAILE